MVYRFGNSYHGKTPKRSIEGPQICTQAKELHPEVIEGRDFVAVKQQFQYRTAAPGKKTGSVWTQWLVFPAGKRYFISMDRIDAVNSSEAMFLRLDMPGHIRHNKGDTFSQVYLSYHGKIPSSEFFENFAPDEKFNYRRDKNETPERMIRAYQVKTDGKPGPWLAGMTLDPEVTSEAWCHQRGYICFIEELHGRAVKAGESFGAAYAVGWFDAPAPRVPRALDRFLKNQQRAGQPIAQPAAHDKHPAHARGEERLHGRRDRDVAVLAPVLGDHRQHLLEEERVPRRGRLDSPARLLRDVGAERVQELVALLRRKRVEAEEGHVLAADGPKRAGVEELGAGQRHQQERRIGREVEHVLDQI